MTLALTLALALALAPTLSQVRQEEAMREALAEELVTMRVLQGTIAAMEGEAVRLAAREVEATDVNGV